MLCDRTEHSQGFSICFIVTNLLNSPCITFNFQNKLYFQSTLLPKQTTASLTNMLYTLMEQAFNQWQLALYPNFIINILTTEYQGNFTNFNFCDFVNLPVLSITFFFIVVVMVTVITWLWTWFVRSIDSQTPNNVPHLHCNFSSQYHPLIKH